MKIIKLGGKTHSGRIYLQDADFIYKNQLIKVKPTDRLDIENLKSRHLARYHFAKSFIRPFNRILDFPCGSGYGSEILQDHMTLYDGLDSDEIVVQYAKEVYSTIGKSFHVKDLTKPRLRNNYYDIIACIEGIEHIPIKYHIKLIKAFYRALRKNGTLIITTPETNNYGQSKVNKYHKGEIPYSYFLFYLQQTFGKSNIEIVTQKDIIHTGEKVNILYGVCHKNEKNIEENN